MPFSVRGIVNARQTMAVTNAQTTEHDAPAVTVCTVSTVRGGWGRGRTGIEGDEACEDVAAAEEDDEDDLRRAEDFAANRAREDHASVGHVVDVRIVQFEGADHVACCGRNYSESLR